MADQVARAMPLGELETFVRRDPRVLCEDNFDRGPQGWTQLLDITTPRGALMLDSEITYGGSRYSLLMSTEDQTNLAEGRPWGMGMALKRLSLPPDVTKLYMDVWWSWGGTHGQDAPRAFEFGIDLADAEGTRRFFQHRWLNYDEQAGERSTKWQVLDTDGYVDVEGAVVDFGYNENKRNLWRTEFVVDVAEGCYDGLRCAGGGWGSLAAVPDDTLREHGPAPHTLLPFANGCNPAFSIRNRLSTANTRCWMNIGYVKLEAL